MSPCTCAAADLTAVTFASGVVLLRCSAHERQAWVVDGRTTDRDAALTSLRTLFVEQRGRSRRPPVARRPRTAAPAPAPAYDPFPQEPADVPLNALLRAHGVQGSWAVA